MLQKAARFTIERFKKLNIWAKLFVLSFPYSICRTLIVDIHHPINIFFTLVWLWCLIGFGAFTDWYFKEAEKYKKTDPEEYKRRKRNYFIGCTLGLFFLVCLFFKFADDNSTL